MTWTNPLSQVYGLNRYTVKQTNKQKDVITVKNSQLELPELYRNKQ